MSQNRQSETAIAALELDPERIGQILLRIVPVSAALGHTRPGSTVRDYHTRPSTAESQFVRDIFTLSTDDLAERWFGGAENASRIACDAQPRLPHPSEVSALWPAS